MWVKVFLVCVGTLLALGFYESKYNEIQEQKRKVGSPRMGSGDMFDSIASVYDQANNLMSLGWHGNWKHLLVHYLDVQLTDRVLDLATGTADVAIKMALAQEQKGKMLGSAPLIVAADPSKEMLRAAQVKIGRNPAIWDGFVSLQLGVGEDIEPLVSRSEEGEDEELRLFDKVAVSFGIRNFEDRKKALQQIRKYTKKSNVNGKLGILEFVAPKPEGLFAFMSPLVANFVYYAVPVIGTVVSNGRWDEYRHLADSIFEFPDPPMFTLMLEEAGFTQCESKDIFIGTVIMWTCSTYVPLVPPEALKGQQPVAGLSKRKVRQAAADASGVEFEL